MPTSTVCVHTCTAHTITLTKIVHLGKDNNHPLGVVIGDVLVETTCMYIHVHVYILYMQSKHIKYC